MATLRKLTLSIDEQVISRARRYSLRHKVSISRLVTRYLAGLGESERGRGTVSKTVKRLRGILPQEASVDEYREFLARQHGEAVPGEAGSAGYSEVQAWRSDAE